MTNRSLATVFSGQEEVVSLQNGESLRVFVRQLSARHHIRYIAFAHDEAVSIELACQAPLGAEPLPEGWVDALTDESHIRLAAIVKDLNFQRASATCQRVAATAEALRPLAEKAATSTT